MLVAIPVETNDMSAEICPSFGRAPLFIIYNTENQKHIAIDNPGASAQGGAGIKAAQILVDSEVHALLVPRCGQNAADVLKAANIALYKSAETSVSDNIALLGTGKLAELKDIHPGFHGHGAA